MQTVEYFGGPWDGKQEAIRDDVSCIRISEYDTETDKIKWHDYEVGGLSKVPGLLEANYVGEAGGYALD